MSKKIFSPQEWENVPSKQEPSHPTAQPLHETPKDHQVDVERIVAEIEARGIDIAPQYNTWVNCGFALAEGLGEGGRNFFHRMSKLHPDYDYAAHPNSTTSFVGLTCLLSSYQRLQVSNEF